MFEAWLDPALAGRFLFATPDGVHERVEVDGRVGGRYRIVKRRGSKLASHFGGYLGIERPRRLVFTFASDPEELPSRVVVEIVAKGEGCEFTLTHEMVPEWADYAERTERAWAATLGNLAEAVLS